MSKICIISNDIRYRHTIKLELMRYFDGITFGNMSAYYDCDILIVDLDSVEWTDETLIASPSQKICISRHAATLNALPVSKEISVLHRPFRDGKLAALCGVSHIGDTALGKDTALPVISADKRTALVGAETVRLTEREGELLYILLTANGDYVSKSELYRAVFGDAEEGEGVVPVYIHYLRRKLETDGRRLIYSRRGGGYCIRSGK